jgi:hypothetical protein
MARSHIALALLITACATPPEIKPQVVIPPPSAPRSEFFIGKVQVQSRETGAEAWQRNEDYARALAEALKGALRAHDKSLAPPPADSIRPKLYLAYAPITSTAKGGRRADAHVEVSLELLDGASGMVRYSTHTRTVIKPSMLSKVGWAPEADQLIRAVLETAAQDFVSRL